MVIRVLRGRIFRGWSSERPGGMRPVLMFGECGFATEAKQRGNVSAKHILTRWASRRGFTFVRKWVPDRCMVACPCGFVDDERDLMTASKFPVSKCGTNPKWANVWKCSHLRRLSGSPRGRKHEASRQCGSESGRSKRSAE